MRSLNCCNCIYVCTNVHCIVFCSACEAAVTGLIDLFLLGVDVDTITSALEVSINKNIE